MLCPSLLGVPLATHSLTGPAEHDVRVLVLLSRHGMNWSAAFIAHKFVCLRVQVKLDVHARHFRTLLRFLSIEAGENSGLEDVMR